MTLFDESTVEETFLIIDAHALIYRAFHAFPPLTNADGEVVGAMYGFLRILLTALKNTEPTYWLAAFDHPAKTKRREEFEFYKANRKEMPSELVAQISLIEEAVTYLGIPEFKCAGIEADDLIGTASRIIYERTRAKALILTGDRDSFQLVNDRIHVLAPNVGRRTRGERGGLTEYNSAGVWQKMKVRPEQIVDYKALAGDGSDNISGVPGIGAKTAVALLEQFGSLEKIYQALDMEMMEGVRAGVVAKLSAGREVANISRKLAMIDRYVDLDLVIEECRVRGYDKEKMMMFLERHGFSSLLKLLPQDEFEAGLQEALF
jgi:DNA polymerase-1